MMAQARSCPLPLTTPRAICADMRIGALFLTVAALQALAGCSLLDFGAARPAAQPTPAVAPPSAPPARPVMGQGQSAAALDSVSAAEKAAALAAPKPAAARELGKAVVALGPPAEAGLWIKAPFITAEGKGRVTTDAGQTLAVDLRPGTGGALLSFAAFRALNLPLTGLPHVIVFAD